MILGIYCIAKPDNFLLPYLFVGKFVIEFWSGVDKKKYGAVNKYGKEKALHYMKIQGGIIIICAIILFLVDLFVVSRLL